MPTFTTTDEIAALALVVAILSAIISAGSLFLEIRRWFEAGPKIHISLIADALQFPEPVDPQPMLVITVTNRGDTPTTITHMIAFAQHPTWQIWRRKPMMTGVVNTTMQPIPFEVGVNKYWMGRLNYDAELRSYRANHQLYVGVICSHSRRNFLKRVPRAKRDIPTETVGASND